VGGARGRQGPAWTEPLTEQRRDGFRERGLQVTRLETFVDAAFAFAVTLLVISTSDQRPESYTELTGALHRVPTFLACFALIGTYWAAHERFSRRFGLEDRATTVLSMALVAGVLVWVYPLRMVVSSGLWFMSGGWVPTELGVGTAGELQSAFRIFAAGFIGLNTVMVLLNLRALRRADVLDLDARERLETRSEIARHGISMGVAVVSIVLSFLVIDAQAPWMLGLPGFAYGLLGVAYPLHYRRLHRQRAALAARPGVTP